MQLRYQTGLTGEQYVSTRAWRDARLDRCPNHESGSCSFARHGTYRRKWPRGALIARWYCPESQTTFSLLPDCLAAQLPGTLEELEEAVTHAEQSPSLMKAVAKARTDYVGLPGAMRWLDRRVKLVRAALRAVILSLPDELAGCRPELSACRKRLGTKAVLVRLRTLAASSLPSLPAPLGLRPRLDGAGNPTFGRQQQMGDSGRRRPP